LDRDKARIADIAGPVNVLAFEIAAHIEHTGIPVDDRAM
jgi:hypothetical protein